MSVVIDVRQSIPLRTALERHDDVIVVKAHRAFPEFTNLRFGTPTPTFEMMCGILVATIYRHDVNGITTKPMCPLRTIRIDRDTERDRPSLSDQFRRLHDLFRGDVVQRPQLVVRSPFAPVPYPFCHFSPTLCHCPLLP